MVKGGLSHLQPVNLLPCLPWDLVQSRRVGGTRVRLDGSSIQRRTLRGPGKPAGYMLVYSIQIKCGLIETTYDLFRPEWEQPKREHLVLSLSFPECSDVFLLRLSAKNRGILSNVCLEQCQSARVQPCRHPE